MLHDSLREAAPAVPPVSEGPEDPFIGERWSGFPVAADESELGHEEKAAYLTGHFDTLYVEDFVRVGVQVGAERMDARLVAEGREPVHTAIVTDLLQSDRVQDVMRAGREDKIPEEPRPLQSTGTFWYQQVVYAQLDPGLLNRTMLSEATSISHRATHQGLGVILDSFAFRTMRDQLWSPKLVAITAALGMHHAAVRGARQSVRPLLGGEGSLPNGEEGTEKAFWSRTLLGNKAKGAFYYLGYLEKSQADMGQALQVEWKDNYVRNRRVLASALLMQSAVTYAGLGHGQVGDIRRPIFRAIGNGFFDAADDKLKEEARKHPHLFTRLERQRLLRGEAPILEEDADEKFE